MTSPQLPSSLSPRLQELSTLDLMIAGTSEAVLMIEGFCDFLTEEQMLEVRPLATPCMYACTGTVCRPGCMPAGATRMGTEQCWRW